MATTFDINQFRTRLKNGGARPNQFEVQFTFPPAISALNSAYARSSSFLVTVAELPGQTIGITPVYYRGREIKLAGDKVFAPFTCTILNDTDFTLRDGLEQWMNTIESNTFKTGVSDPSQYQATLIVNQLDRAGNVLRTYRMIGAFPTDISPVGLDFSANDQLSTFGATFQYQHFDVNGQSSGSIVI